MEVLERKQCYIITVLPVTEVGTDIIEQVYCKMKFPLFWFGI
jgi:hypothetical protein